MIARSVLLVASVALAYGLLAGWLAALPGVMRACLAVLVLVAGVGIWARRKPGDDVPARGRRTAHWLDFAAIAAVILAVESGFLWLLGAAPSPLESVAIALEQHFRPEAAALRAVSGGNDEAHSGNWLWSDEARRPLPRRTSFKPGVKPEVFLRLQDPADAKRLMKSRLYVRAFALSRYEDAAWSPLAVRKLEIAAGIDGFVNVARAGPGDSFLHQVFHAADPGGQNALTALQGVTDAEISPLTRIDDGFHLLPPPAKPGGYEYFAKSTPRRLEDLPDGGLLRAWPDAPEELIELPSGGDFPEKIRKLARQAAGTGPVKEQLLNLQNHLRASLDYSLTTRNSRSLDPIENFLFEERRGHCEYFATAGALMARSLGIPSRVAYGWAGGTWYESAGLFVFRANEAHSWTEVWLEGQGWVLMDPTPQAPVGGDRARVAPVGETLPDALADGEEAEDDPADDAGSMPPRVALWLMAGFGLPAGLIAFFRGRRDFGGNEGLPGSSASGDGITSGYFSSWRKACATHGMAMPPGVTLRRHLTGFSESPEFAAELLAYHYGTRYEGKPGDARFEKLLTRRIRKWERSRQFRNKSDTEASNEGP